MMESLGAMSTARASDRHVALKGGLQLLHLVCCRGDSSAEPFPGIEIATVAAIPRNDAFQHECLVCRAGFGPACRPDGRPHSTLFTLVLVRKVCSLFHRGAVKP
jgi:hypothetical protein